MLRVILNFAQEEKWLLHKFGSATSVYNKGNFMKSLTQFHDFIFCIISTLEARDSYTSYHSSRVAEMMKAINMLQGFPKGLNLQKELQQNLLHQLLRSMGHFQKLFVKNEHKNAIFFPFWEKQNTGSFARQYS